MTEKRRWAFKRSNSRLPWSSLGDSVPCHVLHEGNLVAVPPEFRSDITPTRRFQLEVINGFGRPGMSDCTGCLLQLVDEHHICLVRSWPPTMPRNIVHCGCSVNEAPSLLRLGTRHDGRSIFNCRWASLYQNWDRKSKASLHCERRWDWNYK